MIEVVKIRVDDYYGGDVILSYDSPDDAVILEWKSWGKYGGCTLVLSEREAQLLADALQSAPWREDELAARETVT